MKRRSIVFWNVQRLFGSQGSPIEEALSLASGKKTRASREDVVEKTRTIAATIARIGEIAGRPLLVGIAEIESSALARTIGKAMPKHKLVDVDSVADDETGFALEGLNLSLLYDPEQVEKVARLRSHVLDRTFDTRDILEVDFELKNGSPLSALVNHWPSRLAGEGASRRIAAAHYLNDIVASKVRFSATEMWNKKKKRVDLPPSARLRRRARHPLVVMGDFNDEVFDESIDVLNATIEPDPVVSETTVRGRSRRDKFRSYVRATPRLLNPFWSVVGRGGSYYRSPRWRTYDQILLSRGVLDPIKEGPKYVDGSAFVFQEREVERPDGTKISLTNRGGKPISYDPKRGRGCSDHFPVVISVEL